MTFKPFDEMTDAEQDAANEFAWARAADRLRQTLSLHPEFDLTEAREFAHAAIEADIAEDRRWIARAQRARATKLDKRGAENSAERIQRYSLEQGFIFEVEA